MKKIIKFVKNINKQIVFNVFVVIAIVAIFDKQNMNEGQAIYKDTHLDLDIKNLYKRTDDLFDITDVILVHEKDIRTLFNTTNENAELVNKKIKNIYKNFDIMDGNIKVINKKFDTANKNIDSLFENDNRHMKNFKKLDESREIANRNIKNIYDYIKYTNY